MALVVKDRVKQFSATAGTGTLTLGGTPTGFQAFSVLGDGSTTYYAIVDNNNGDWEVGLGTYTASGTTLSRDTVLESSNSGSLVSFGSDTKEVFVTYPAEKAVYGQANGNVELPANLAFTGTGNRITGDFSNATLANRVAFQSSTVNGATTVNVIPNGTSQISSLVLNSTSTVTDASTAQLVVTDAEGSFRSGRNGAGSYLPMTFFTGGSERVRIDTSGNVGIGTTSPSSKLRVEGTAQFTGDGAGAPSSGTGIEISGAPDGAQNRILAFNRGASTWQALDIGAASLTFTTNFSERLLINSEGDLINNGVFYYNARTISASVTLSATENAMSVGPLEINSGVVVTVPDGGSWSVL